MRECFFRFIRRLSTPIAIALLAAIVTACGTIPQVRAEQRLFLPLSLEFLGSYQLPETHFQNTQVGGLSALSYDRATSQFYALSDDRSQHGPARFYRLKVLLDRDENGKTHLNQVEIDGVTPLKTATGETYPPGTFDPEGFAISPRHTALISSESIPSQKINAGIAEYDLATGQLQQTLRLPERYLPDEPDQPPRGTAENFGFEALALSAPSTAPEDPFRLFCAPESALLQDREELTPERGPRLRLLHYVINPFGPPAYVSENFYPLDPAPLGSLIAGLTELVALEREGFMLSLERTYGITGGGAKIFQVSAGDATDISRIETLQGELGQIRPIRKQLLLDLQTLGIPLDNFEAMALGPHLPDGGQMLMLASDNQLNENQKTEFLLFRLLESPKASPSP